VFSRLSDKLQDVLKDVRGHGRISEGNISSAMREIRMALLDADVDYAVAKKFIARVKEKAMGDEVLRSVTPGQQIVKIFQDELAQLLGGDAEPLNLDAPARIMMVGLNGAGKTTTSGKLARHLKREGRSPALVACDLMRPAAIRQLATVAEQVDVPVYTPELTEKDVLKVARDAIAWAEDKSISVLIFDTAGRQEVDEALIAELAELKALVQPRETLLVADSATGQQAVQVASRFDEVVGISGIILTKLDGDARGGAALSMREVTQKPIKFSGLGEKLDQFDVFYPDRMAGRILGMGDVVSLVERAAMEIDEDEAASLEKKLRTGKLDLNDMLSQMRMLKRMGPLENIIGMLPGMSNVPTSSADDGQMKRTEAILLSMTPTERAKPDILNARRRQRVARGSGTTVTEVNNLLRRYTQMRKMMKKGGNMKKLMKKAQKAGTTGGFEGLNFN